MPATKEMSFAKWTQEWQFCLLLSPDQTWTWCCPPRGTVHAPLPGCSWPRRAPRWPWAAPSPRAHRPGTASWCSAWCEPWWPWVRKKQFSSHKRTKSSVVCSQSSFWGHQALLYRITLPVWTPSLPPRNTGISRRNFSESCVLSACQNVCRKPLKLSSFLPWIKISKNPMHHLNSN